MPTAKTHGAQFMNVDNTAVRWPSDGQGGVTDTAASSAVADSSRVVITGVLLKARHSSATTLTLYKHDGTTAFQVITIKADATGIPLNYLIDFGSEGIGLDSGFSAKISNTGTTPTILYMDYDR
jgi:hypothetical protein